jgi:hypothetical protein
MARTRFCICLPPPLCKRLQGHARSHGSTVSGVIEAAVDAHLGDEHDWEVLFRRLDRHTRAFTRLQRDLDIMSEAFAVFVQIWFAHTPRLPNSQQAAAQADARQRYDQFAEDVAKQIASGKTFVEDLAAPIEGTDPQIHVDDVPPEGSSEKPEEG